MKTEIERFLLVKQSENSSPNTIRAYRADLVELNNFMGVDQSLTQISREIVRAFLAFLHRKGIDKSSAIRKLAAIKGCARWLVREQQISDDTYQKIFSIKPPKAPERLPEIPSEEELSCLLYGDFPTAFPERDRLLLELLYGSGLRVSEAVGIRVGDFRPEQHGILIHGKGGMFGKSAKLRLVPLNPSSERALAQYLEKRGSPRNDALFLPVRDRYKSAKPLNVRSVGRMLLHITRIRGLQPMNPHLLRHACATHMLDHGCPLDVIAAILGHDNLDVTAHYAQVSTRLMLREYNAAHPHAASSSQEEQHA